MFDSLLVCSPSNLVSKPVFPIKLPVYWIRKVNDNIQIKVHAVILHKVYCKISQGCVAFPNSVED